MGHRSLSTLENTESVKLETQVVEECGLIWLFVGLDGAVYFFFVVMVFVTGKVVEVDDKVGKEIGQGLVSALVLLLSLCVEKI